MFDTILYVVLGIAVVAYCWRRFNISVYFGTCKCTGLLDGKVVIVTGCNTGIGKETVLELCRRGATVIMACRNPDSSKEAANDIHKQLPQANLIQLPLDLSSLESVRSFCNIILERFQQINLLINNAGLYYPSTKQPAVGGPLKTQDGFELHFGVNYLGHFLLTLLLLPILKASAPSRIVNVASQMHQIGKIDFDNLNGEKGFGQFFFSLYNNSKLANVYFSYHLSKVLQGTGVNTYALCPGLVHSDVRRDTNIKWYDYLYWPLFLFVFAKETNQGAQTTLHCAISEKLNNETGLYYNHCKLDKAKSFTDEDAQKLWEVSLELVKPYLK